jgi:hypothetical protein
MRITKARFVFSPFTSEEMVAIGNVAVDSIKARILRGQTVNDTAARPLSAKYLKRKTQYGGRHPGRAPLRDWYFRGATLRAMAVTSASENSVRVGFTTEQADQIAHRNNLREKQFGASPKDLAAVNAAVLATLRQQRVVAFRRAA